MQRRFLAWALMALVFGGAVSDARAAAPTPLRAKLASCETGRTPASRAATFTASMPAKAATRRMWMRFELLQRRAGDQEFEPVQGVPGWGTWQKSEPGRPGFIVSKRVEQLLAPAVYRAVVRFRWYARGGKLLRAAARTTAVCEQPDPRPDLVAGRLTATAQGPTTATYSLTVRNVGAGDAPGFGVVFIVEGRHLGPVAVSPLAAGSAGVAAIAGPRCLPGSTVTVVVDAGGAVEEAREDAVVARPCPR